MPVQARPFGSRPRYALRDTRAALIEVPRRWLAAQAPLLVAVAASLSVHGLPYLGLGALAGRIQVHAAAPVVVEMTFDDPPEPEPEPPPSEVPPELPAVVVPKPEPVRIKTRPVKPKEVAPEPPPEAPAREPETPAVNAAAAPGPTVTAATEQATPTGCMTGVCLPVGQSSGPGRVGVTGTAGAAGPGKVPAVARPAGPDKEAVPLFRVKPAYPELAEERELEGWVLVRFSITKNGTVVTPVVVKSEPSRIFDAAALEAILKWKYQPTLRDGQAVERSGVTVKISFELE